MAILVSSSTRLLVQGITGREGATHTAAMLQYGTKIPAGVTPGRGGSDVSGVPVYNTVQEAVRKHPELNASVVFVPAAFAADAVYEALDNGIGTIITITERIAVHDSLKLLEYAKIKGARIIGPNCPGVITPGECKVGIMPGHLFSQGRVGVVSRSGTLTYEIAEMLTGAGLGQSTAVGIGGDPVTGLSFVEAAEMFERDEGTEVIVVIGEIGGDAEERLASRIRTSFTKPVVAFIAGYTAPPGKRMGHAGAIISLGAGTAASKKDAFRSVGVEVADLPSQVPKLVQQLIRKT